MKFYTILYGISIIVGLCGALPIPSMAMGERNMFLIGAVAFISFGAVLAGCVCCRRRKKGFELSNEKDPKEFTNESGTLEPNKIEYPILRALSPEIQRNNEIQSASAVGIDENLTSSDPRHHEDRSPATPAAIVVSLPVVNNSNEHLIVDDDNDNDNNNGPISPADLENIENNNAIDYIQNQNEIGIVIEPSPYSRNRNLDQPSRHHEINNDVIEVEEQQQQQLTSPSHIQIQIEETFEKNNQIPVESYSKNLNKNENLNDENNALQDFVITSSTDFLKQQKICIESSQNFYANKNDINNIEILNHLKDSEKYLLNSNNNVENSLNDNKTTNKENHVQENVPIFNINNSQTKYHPENGNNLENIIINTTETEFNINELECNNQTAKISTCEFLCSDISETDLKDETSSITSESSEKSIEISSVEEALRALDIAIGDDPNSENCSGEEDDNVQPHLPYDINKFEEYEEEPITYEHVIKNLLATKGMNGVIYPNHITRDEDNINPSHLEDEIQLKEIVRNNAIQLVDSILNESQQIVEEKNLTLENLKNLNMHETFVTAYNCSVQNNIEIVINGSINNNDDDQKEIYAEPKTDLNVITSPLNKNKIKSVDSFENLFDNDFIPSTSTPCIKNKFQTNFNFNANSIDDRKNCGVNLFDEMSPLNDTRNDVLQNENSFDMLNCQENKDNMTFDKNATYNADATFNANGTYNANQTLNLTDAKQNETFEVNKTFNAIPSKLIKETDYTYPGDPCSSKQAIERDQFLRPLIKFQREELTSEELNTITPVNTPIELNYNQETWDKMTKPSDDDMPRSGWFLHPQQMISGHMGDKSELIVGNTTFDVADQQDDDEEEDAANLELTFDMLRKQLAEVLPQPQGMAGPPDFSDDDDENCSRTFDEYRSPLDGLLGLLDSEIENSSSSVAQNEVFINYKRTLSPIMEESEGEETCKTFVMNETKCMDSTSTGCVETGEAIMGVTKTLMASNDTLFNFEDTLGDKDDSALSPRLSSRSDSQATTPVKNSGNRSAASSIATNSSDTEKGDNNQTISHNDYTIVMPDRRTPPKTLSFADINDVKTENSDFCSPVEQKTFSDGTISTSTDRVSSDISPTLDNETTFTMNTIDDKTCVTVIIKDDERISEISEPEWGSAASYGIGVANIVGENEGATCDMNSLTDIPSLDFNINSFDREFEGITNNGTDTSSSEEHTFGDEKHIIIEPLRGPLIIINSPNDNEKTSLDDENTTESSNCLDEINNIEEINQKVDSGHDDSGHSTQLSLDDKSNNTSHNISAQETDSIGDITNQQQQQQQILLSNLSDNINESNDKENCEVFIQNEIEFSSSQHFNNSNLNSPIITENDINVTITQISNTEDMSCLENSKENSDPNIKKINNYNIGISNGATECTGNLEKHGVYQNIVQMNGHQDAVIKVDRSIDYVENNARNNIYRNTELTSSIILPSTKTDDELIVADDVINHLSGEEDPWVETVHDLHFTGPTSIDILNTSFTASNSTSEWDSDVDDSHSSEEFMYVRGSSANEDILRYIKQESYHNDDEKDSDLWISNDDDILKRKSKVGNVDEERISEGSSSEYEGEFVPSSWDSMAMPARSALKSPDKNSSSEEDSQNENKKRRSVAFKKQRYHSVYEYPKESLSLSPAYSEPNLSSHKSYYEFSDKNSLEEFNGGFVVSSSMRPFHGVSQFNACHTWPTDSDFSWSQVEDHESFGNETNLATYNGIKWTHPMNNEEINSTELNKIDESQRPDSGVGESAEMLSDRQSIGELCHAKTKLRLPIQGLSTTPIFNQFSTTDSNEINNKYTDDESIEFVLDKSDIEMQENPKQTLNFSTFGKNKEIENDIKFLRTTKQDITQKKHIKPAINIILVDEINNGVDNIECNSSTSSNDSNPSICKVINVINNDNNPINTDLIIKSEKIRQSDSTDEDSGIESIMKMNNRESD